MVLRLLQHLETAVMIKEMDTVTHTSTLSGSLYEGLAAKELTAGRRQIFGSCFDEDEDRRGHDHVLRTKRRPPNCVPIQLTKRAILPFPFHWTKFHTGQRKGRKGNNVIVKYLLVSPDSGRWTLLEKNRQLYKGYVYYQRVIYHDEIHLRT